MPPYRFHNPRRHEVQSTLLPQSNSLVALKRIPTNFYAPITPSYAEPSLRLGLVVPLTLMPHRSRGYRHLVHQLPPVFIAPTPTAPPLSSSLLCDNLVGTVPMQRTLSTDNNTYPSISTTTSDIIRRSSLYTVLQGRYALRSKSGKTRYGNIKKSSLDCVTFGGGPEKEWGHMTVTQILDGLTDAYLDGANETVLQRHGTNITLHILWPDHTPWNTLVRTKSWKDSSAPITRGELALRLARALKRFTVSAKRDVTSAAYSTIPVPGDIALESLYLLRFYQVTQGSWQVELATVVPTTNA